MTVHLATPTIVRKVSVRQPSPTGTNLECLAKVVKFRFPDGTTVRVKFEGDKDEDQYLAAPRGDWGGEYAYADVKPMSKLFGLPVIESYEIEVIATQGKCVSGNTKLRGIEMRGQILSNIAMRGRSFKDCQIDPVLGMFRSNANKYGCDLAYDGGSENEKGIEMDRDAGHAWITDGLGPGTKINTKFIKKRNIYAFAVRQNEYSRAKKVSLKFVGGSKAIEIRQMLENRDGLQILAIPGENGADAKSVELEILSTYEKYEIPVGQGWRLSDNFKTKDFDTTQWEFPNSKLRGVESIRYGYDAAKSATPLYFEGHSPGKQPIRSKLRFPLSHTEISVTMQRTSKCSNQFIILSPNKNYKFSQGPEDNTIKFVYNCDDRYIYGPDETDQKHQLESFDYNVGAPCPYKEGMNVETWKLEITPERVVFATDGCSGSSNPPLIMKLEKGAFAAKGGQFFVYVGASNDFPNQRSYFGPMEVRSWGTGLRDLAYMGRADE